MAMLTASDAAPVSPLLGKPRLPVPLPPVAPILGAPPVAPPAATPTAPATSTGLSRVGPSAMGPEIVQSALPTGLNAMRPVTPESAAPMTATGPGSVLAQKMARLDKADAPSTAAAPATPVPAPVGTSVLPLPAPEQAAPMTPTAPPALPPGTTSLGGDIAPPPAGGYPTVGPMLGTPPTPTADPTAGISTFGPGNDLTAAQINPAASAALTTKEGQAQTAQDLTLQGLQGLSSAPDRQTLAKQALDNFIAQTDPGYQQRLRQSQDLSATMGRVGSGMAADDVVRLGRSREQEIVAQEANLANETAGQQLADQESKLAAAQSVTGTLTGTAAQRAAQDAAARGELRTERGYQAGQSQQNVENEANQRAMEAALQGQQFGQNVTAAELGMGVANADTAQANAAQAAAANQIGQSALERSLGPMGSTAPAAPAAPTAGAGPGFTPPAYTPSAPDVGALPPPTLPGGVAGLLPPGQSGPTYDANGNLIDPLTGQPLDPTTGLPVGGG